MDQIPSQRSSEKTLTNRSVSSNGFHVSNPVVGSQPFSPDMTDSQDREASKVFPGGGVGDTQKLEFPFREQQPRQRFKFGTKSLRGKATLLAVAIGTLPVLLVGATAYLTASQGLREQIIQSELTNASDLEDKLNIFIKQSYDDIVTLSKLEALTNPKVRSALTITEKNTILKGYLDASQTYNSIVAYDPEAVRALASAGGEFNLKNIVTVDYSTAVQEGNRPVIVDPRVAGGNNEFSFFAAAPLQDQETNTVLGIIRTRTPMTLINELFGVDAARGQEFYLTDSSGQVTASNNPDALQKNIKDLFPSVASKIQQEAGKELTTIATEGGMQQLFTYVPNTDIANSYNLKWGLLLARPTTIAFAPQRQLLVTLVVGTVVVALLVAIVAAVIANRAVRPVLSATNAVERIGRGELDTYVNVRGDDELAVLGSNINSMAERIKTLLQEQVLAAEEQRRQKEELQERALELLEEVDPINEGDLTIRARVTEDDIGTIADAYNATVSNLREIVTKVQVTASNVTETTRSNELSVQTLSKEALYQAEKIAAALDQVKEMAGSVRLVAANAEKAAIIVQQANQMVEEGDLAMNRTVDGINAIRGTVAETRQKVKYLGESSQRITAVVNLISSFAAQTKMLAFNASIEAKRAGKEGRGFAVVADEVRTLAQQSAEASTEIEKLVATIQGETSEVIAAMEVGTEQVVIGTKLVEETRQSLNKITAASAEINELVAAISEATIQQTQSSEGVTQTMAEVAEIASRTSQEADQVTFSFQELRRVAEELQQDAGRFKVS